MLDNQNSKILKCWTIRNKPIANTFTYPKQNSCIYRCKNFMYANKPDPFNLSQTSIHAMFITELYLKLIILR